MKHYLPFAILAIMAALSGAAERTWKSSCGRYSIEADLLAVKDGSVRLRKGDGQAITLPLERLSAGDGRYVNSRIQRDTKCETRIWTSRDGRYKTEAKLISLEAGTLWLRKPDGEVVLAPLKDVCDEDRLYVERLTTGSQPAEGSSLQTAGLANSAASRQQEVPLDTGAARGAVLELKRFEPLEGAGGHSGPPADAAFRSSAPQHFYVQVGHERTSSMLSSYRKAVHKEPEFESEHPVRGVAKLGTGQFGFVLDAAEPDAKGYGRLYFDINRNGDLTDDGVIEAVQDGTRSSSTYAQHRFPRVDLTIPVGQQQMDYAFLFSVYWRKSSSYEYVSASLNAAAYRVGDVMLEGKPRRIVLLDLNSNGRFDDVVEVSESRGSDGQIRTSYGDLLLVDADPGAAGGYDVTQTVDRQHLSSLCTIDGLFYDVDLPPTGERITLTPSPRPVGYVTTPNQGFGALIRNDEAVLKITGGPDEPIPLPAGRWKLLSYTIQHAEHSSVSARATNNCPQVTVRAHETVPMPFGPPYKPVVKSHKQGKDKASLSLSIVGCAGEICTDHRVAGKRPPGPKFAILTADGEVVEKHLFKYG